MSLVNAAVAAGSIHVKWCPWCRLPLPRFDMGTFFQLDCLFLIHNRCSHAYNMSSIKSSLVTWASSFKVFWKMTLTLTLKGILFVYVYFYWIAPHRVYFLPGKISSEYSQNCVDWDLNYTMKVISIRPSHVKVF